MDHRCPRLVTDLLTLLLGTVATLAADSALGDRARTTAPAPGGGAVAGTVAMWPATAPPPAPARPRLAAPRTAWTGGTGGRWLPDAY